MRAMLMRTCLADAVAPAVWRAARRALVRTGVEVMVPRAQTCCGQPGWSAGHPDQARGVARQCLRAFAGADAVVVPSGSCASMLVHGYPELFAGEPEEGAARDLAGRAVELTQFLDRHGLVPRPRGGGRVTYHDSCHMLRVLGERETPRRALGAVRGLELVEMPGREVCCGFGGMFALDFPELSGRLGEEKARAAAATGADELVACDLSCLLHIVGRAHRTGVRLKVRHVAEVLAG